MFAGLCRLLDRLAIRSACASVRETTAVFHHAREARALLESPDLFSSPVNAPHVQFRDRTRFSFRSPLPTPWPENNQVLGRLYRGHAHWQTRPTIILLHGWNGELMHALQFPYLAWRFRRKGLNVVTVELPYHGHRRPSQPGAVRNFLSADLFRMFQAVQQSVADLRALVLWLEAEGVPAVGLWGISLGGWLAGLLACLELNLACAALMTPPVRMDQAIAQLPFCKAVQESLESENLVLDLFNLTAHTPRLSPAKILLLAGSHDLFVSMEAVVDLWQSWRQPTLWRLPHGHISMLLSPSTLERTVNWLSKQTGSCP